MKQVGDRPACHWIAATVSCLEEVTMRKLSWRQVGAILSLVVLLTVLFVPAASASSELSPASGAATSHVVRRGETLFGIARYYGVDPYYLASFNGITNLNRIYAGQVLRIPGGGYNPHPETNYYTVRRGDNLTVIAYRFHTTVAELMRLNHIANPNRIYAGMVLVVRGYAPPPPPPPPPGPGPIPAGCWNANYFNTQDLTGPAIVSRCDANIDFNWGWGSPSPAVMPDHFSARWTRTFWMQGGTYRLTARVDDGIRVSINGTLVLDQWREQAVTTFTQDFAVGTGNQTFTVEYFEQTGLAEVHLNVQRLY
jgi:LysM repeat protein